MHTLLFLAHFVGAFFSSPNLSFDQKIGQLLIADCRADEDHQELFSLVKEGLVGSVLLKGLWSKEQEIAFTTQLRSTATIPLFIMQDCEWGFAMRVTDLLPYPKAGTLAHITDLSLLENLGKMIAYEAKELGVNFCLAPVCDVDSNPLNPIIGLRAFGSDPKQVAERTRAVIRGIQGEGLIACAKHFPGHGDTHIDSHLALPVVETLRDEELYPFQEAIQEGVSAIMIGHIAVSSIDLTPSSLSPVILSTLDYEGLLITDDLGMGAITSQMSLEEAAVKALLAGNDLIMVSKDIRNAIDKIRADVPIDVINRHLSKVLSAKSRLQETQNLPMPDPYTFKKTLYEDLIPHQKLIKTEILPIYQPQVRYRRLPLTDEQLAHLDAHPNALPVLFCNPYPPLERSHILAYEDDPIAHEVVQERLLP